MNILIIRFSALGDLVTCDLIFKTIRFFYPNATIKLLTSALGKGLYQDTSYFDSYIVHKDFLSTIKKVRNKKYDLIVNLQCNTLSHLIVMFSKKKKVVLSASSLLEKLIGQKRAVKSVEQTMLEMDLDSQKIKEYCNRDDFFQINMPVKIEKLFDSAKKVIVISTGSSEFWKSKQWGIEKYKNLIDQLLLQEYLVVLVGTKLELNDAKSICDKYSKVINYVNQTNLTQLKNILAQADIFIGNDSGPAHIAAAVGTNTITIFGPTDTKHCVQHMPYLGKHICLKPDKTIKCYPCYKGICPTKLECMESISIENVYQNINKLLKGENI